MSNGVKLCRSCMNSVPVDAANCPNCGYNGSQQNDMNCLPIGYRLAGRYIFGMRKAYDGDSSTYIAFDSALNRRIEIKEFLPQGFCRRNPETMELVPNPGCELLYKTSLMDFSELYKNLRKIEDNPGIVRVYDFMDTNATAYAIIDSFDGITLREFLSMAGGKITCEQATKILNPIFGTLEAVHSVNLIHRGISPETIFVNRNGDVRLGGFATSQVRTRGTEVASKLFSGFSAPEQYSSTMWQGTATDVYALAAVFYRCVTGITPQDAEQRRGYDTLEPLSNISQMINPVISRAISVAMLINSQERTQYANELLSILQNPVMPSENAYSAAGIRSGANENAAYQSGGYQDSRYSDDSYDEEYEDGDNEYEERPARTSKKKKKEKAYPLWIEKMGVRNFWIMVMVLCVALVAVATILLAKSLFVPKIYGEDVEQSELGKAVVPDYVGLELDDVINMLDHENFTYAYEYVFESENNINVVVRQTPDEGTEVPQLTCITLVINKGIRVVVPNVVGMHLNDAINSLKEEGLDYTVVYEVSDRPEGEVLKQSIGRGAKVDPGTVIALTVAVPPPSDEPEEDDPDDEDPDDGNPDDGNPGTTPGGGSIPIILNDDKSINSLLFDIKDSFSSTDNKSAAQLWCG